MGIMVSHLHQKTATRLLSSQSKADSGTPEHLKVMAPPTMVIPNERTQFLAVVQVNQRHKTMIK